MAIYLPEALRNQVSERANHCCEYCLIPEMFLATSFHIDHVRSLKHKGNSHIDNLAYACPHYNQHKGSDVGTFAEEDGETLVRFFNPRKDDWHDHFELDSGEIIPKSTIGKATVSILNINQPERVILRNELSRIGQYPKQRKR